jgi:hypothetical protein
MVKNDGAAEKENMVRYFPVDICMDVLCMCVYVLVKNGGAAEK